MIQNDRHLQQYQVLTRLNEAQDKFVKKYRKEHPDWNLSQFVREKIDELMYASSNQIKEMIKEKQKLKENVNIQLDNDIIELQQKYGTACKRDQEIKQRLTTDRRTDYGGLEKKDSGN